MLAVVPLMPVEKLRNCLDFWVLRLEHFVQAGVFTDTDYAVRFPFSVGPGDR